MFLGLNLGAWLFWVNLLIAVVCVGMTVWSCALSAKSNAVVNGVSFIVTAAAAGLLWTAQGACVLPQPSTVEFRQGMTLCPGQAAKIRIEIPLGGKL